MNKLVNGKWKNIKLGDAIDFNPPETIKRGVIAKKIPMEKLIEFRRKISGFENSPYSGGAKFRNGDTLLAKITPCLENGKTAQVDILEENEVAFGSTEFIVLRGNEHTINDFVFYLAKSPAFRRKAISCMEGTSGRKRVNEKALKLQVLPIPDLPTQKKIADVLSALDAKIELNARVNAELESLAKTIYDYWFVQFAPHKSAGGGLVWNEELKREIPLGWEADNIMRLGDLLGGGTPKTSEPSYWGGNIPFFTPKDADDSIFVLNTMDYITKAGLESCSSRLYPKGTIFITARGTVGKINVASQDMAMNQSCYAIQAKPEINYYFLHQHSMHLVQYLKAKSNGSIFDAIVSNDIKLTPIVIPPLLLIQKFGEHIKDLYEKILVNKQESQALTEVRDWLLPLLMNGQVKV